MLEKNYSIKIAETEGQGSLARYTEFWILEFSEKCPYGSYIEVHLAEDQLQIVADVHVQYLTTRFQTKAYGESVAEVLYLAEHQLTEDLNRWWAQYRATGASSELARPLNILMIHQLDVDPFGLEYILKSKSCQTVKVSHPDLASFELVHEHFDLVVLEWSEKQFSNQKILRHLDASVTLDQQRNSRKLPILTFSNFNTDIKFPRLERFYQIAHVSNSFSEDKKLKTISYVIESLRQPHVNISSQNKNLFNNCHLSRI